MSDDFCFVHSDHLGYEPKPGFRGAGAGGWTVTIDANGFRTAGDTLSEGIGPVILAVGNSYTFGEEVSDADTWPAQLQRLTGCRVLNGGVSGYGIDQIVLRAEQLANNHHPSMIIVGFIADDIRRAEMRRVWWRDKPWFSVEDGSLILKGAPVPVRTQLPPRFHHRIERVLISLPLTLQQIFGYHVRQHPAGHGIEIALHLLKRLATLEARHRCRIVMMAQYHPQVWVDKIFATEQRRTTQDVLNHAKSLGLATVDTFTRFKAEPSPASFYINTHMNARGNLAVASLLAARLQASLHQNATPHFRS